jgi:hypothetical protein
MDAEGHSNKNSSKLHHCLPFSRLERENSYPEEIAEKQFTHHRM